MRLGNLSQSPAEAISDAMGMPRASATLATFNTLTLRSPRSILPMCERSIPAASASASCERPRSSRAVRMAAPSLSRRPSLSVLIDWRATRF